jgi:hypothetical protein
MEPQDSPVVESEPSKTPPEAPEAPQEAEDSDAASGGGWGSWTSGWIDANAASSLLGKAMSSVNSVVEVAKTKVRYFWQYQF